MLAASQVTVGKVKLSFGKYIIFKVQLEFKIIHEWPICLKEMCSICIIQKNNVCPPVHLSGAQKLIQKKRRWTDLVKLFRKNYCCFFGFFKKRKLSFTTVWVCLSKCPSLQTAGRIDLYSYQQRSYSINPSVRQVQGETRFSRP